MATVFLLTLASTTVAAAAAASENQASPPQDFSVTRTFDQHPFTYQINPVSTGASYRLYRLTYPSPVVTPHPANNVIPADYYLPKDIGPESTKRPAVICLHILNGNFELEQMTCSLLASRGIPAVMFKLPYYGERGLPEGRRALAADPRHFAAALPQGVADFRRTIDVLAARPEVDPQRIGVVGISMGGILGATAAGEDPRVWRTVLILAGGDLMSIIHHARETRELSGQIRQRTPAEQQEIEKAIAAVEPLRFAAGLRDRARDGRVLMINAAQDEVIPKACTQKLATALGIEDRVVWLEGLGHYTALAALPQALTTTADFFAADLPADAKKAAPPAKPSPQRVLATILHQCGDLLVGEPQAGRCHLADLSLSATLRDGKKIEGRLRLVHGTKPKFALEAKVPQFGQVALGQGAAPWMASGEKAVFKGVLPAGARPSDPLALADPKDVVRLQVFCGALSGMGLVPDMLDRWVTLSDEKPADGPPAIRIARKDRPADSARLVLRGDGTTPQSLSFDVEGVRGTLEFRVWQFNTVAQDGLFAEPAGVPVKEVDAGDLYRMFTAMFNFAMESLP